jgi:putative peptidoglycan lipid II flippase
VFLLKLALAVCFMGAVVWFASGSTTEWLTGTGRDRVSHLALVVALGAGSYFVALWLLGFRLRDFSQRGVE